jgi:hypothetical protein
MPFLTRDLPPGGRHIDRATPPVAPAPATTTRMRQLLPVGLLVAASSAGVALTPMIGGTSAVADADHDGSPRVAGTVAVPDVSVPSRTTVSRGDIARASYVLPRAGKHRATNVVEQSLADTAVVGGKHRASGTALSSATPTATTHQSTAPKHAAAVSVAKTTTAAKSAATSTASAASTATQSATPTPAATTPTATATQSPDLVTSTVDGVLGTVGTLLGGN